MLYLAIENDMKIEDENDHYEGEANENLKAISISLFIIQSQIAEFKQNLISAQNFVKLNGIVLFEEKLRKIRSIFNVENIDTNELLGQRYQSISVRLKSILQIIIQIKENAAIHGESDQTSRMEEMEQEIGMLIHMLQQ